MYNSNIKYNLTQKLENDQNDTNLKQDFNSTNNSNQDVKNTMSLEENFENSMKANPNYNLDTNRLNENNQLLFDSSLKDNFLNDSYSNGPDHLEKNGFPLYDNNKDQVFRPQISSSSKRQHQYLPPLPSNYVNRNNLYSEQLSYQNAYIPTVSRQNSQLKQNINDGVFSGNFTIRKSKIISNIIKCI